MTVTLTALAAVTGVAAQGLRWDRSDGFRAGSNFGLIYDPAFFDGWLAIGEEVGSELFEYRDGFWRVNPAGRQAGGNAIPLDLGEYSFASGPNRNNTSERRTVIIGGRSRTGGGSGGISRRVYDLRERNWSGGQPGSPPARRAAAMAFHEGADAFVMVGGFDERGDALEDAWYLPRDYVVSETFAEWIPIDPGAADHPGARAFASLAWDDITQSLVLYGGETGSGSQILLLHDTWRLEWANGSFRWVQEINTPSPPMSSRTAMAPHPDGGLVLFGGTTTNPDFIAEAPTFLWDGARWRRARVEGRSPIVRRGARMAARIDLVSNPPRVEEVLLAGGETFTFGTEPEPLEKLSDFWIWKRRNAPFDGAWERISQGPPPSRGGFGFAFDRVRNALVVDGGALSRVALPGTWQFGRTNTGQNGLCVQRWEWALRGQRPFGQGLDRAILVDAPVFGGVISLGGSIEDGSAQSRASPLPTVWSSGSGTWSSVVVNQRTLGNPPGAPTSRPFYFDAAVFDPARRRVVAYASVSSGLGPGIWELGDDGRWSGPRGPAALPGPVRMAHDRYRAQTILVGDDRSVVIWDGAVARSIGLAPGTLLAHDEQRGRTAFLDPVERDLVHEWDGRQWFRRRTPDEGPDFDSTKGDMAFFLRDVEPCQGEPSSGRIVVVSFRYSDVWQLESVATATALNSGESCSASQPQVSVERWPYVGQALRIRYDPWPARSVSPAMLLLVAAGPDGIASRRLTSVPDCFQLVEPAFFAVTSADGRWETPIPNLPALAGIDLHLQGAFAESSASGPALVTTSRFTARIGTP